MSVLYLDPALAAQFERGRKRQHRMRQRPERRAPYKAGAVLPVQTTRIPRDAMTGEVELDPATGEIRRRRMTISHVLIEAIGEQLLHEITDLELEAEGFDSYQAFAAWWWERHREGPGLTEGPPKRWRRHQATYEIPIWVVTFKPAETRRYLAPGHVDPQHVPPDARGYLHNVGQAMDEAEAVDGQTQEAITLEAHQADARTALERQAEWERKTMAARMVELETLASRSNTVDVSRELRLIDNTMSKAKAKLDRDRAAA